ncbi:MAG: NAD(P)/FAD-dependent oxidoreductase [Methanimicrococcus sp.]|nr:NAD(P)/FAD-dependent oxidoreductase [Methanimicrococcus sp.]
MPPQKVVIIGSGLGGLLTAAQLSKKGYQVDVYERLALIGGRFANINYQGYQMSTGALHMMPHGVKGPLALMLQELGVVVEIVPSVPMSTVRLPKNMDETDYKNGFVDIPYWEFKKHLTFKKKAMMALLTFCYKTRLMNPKNINFKPWYSKYIQDDRIDRCADAFCGWSLSTMADEVPTQEMFAIFDNILKYGGPGIIVGGCQSVIAGLLAVIEENGGNVYSKKEVTDIKIEGGKAVGIIVDDTPIPADLVISDIGHTETWDLCTFDDSTNKEDHQTYLDKLKDIKPSAGLKICFSCDERVLLHDGVLITPYARRINGVNEVTNADPNLAPPGKHLVMCHQRTALDRLNQIEEEIELGLEDVKDLFPDKNIEILMIQTHFGGWPVNRAFSGTDSGNATPIPNLIIVGDGAKGKGGIEIEGITFGVRNALEMIEKI